MFDSRFFKYLVAIGRWARVVLMVIVLLAGCKEKDAPTAPAEGGPEPPLLPIFFDFPAWHPTGRWIASEHSDSVDTDEDEIPDDVFSGIWLIHAETGQPYPLIQGFELPAWSPDGKTLAMVRHAQIFCIDVLSLEPPRVDMNSLRQLTTEGRNFFPAWNSDGTWIAYDSNLNDPVGANIIWKMRANGTDKRDISEHGIGEWRMPHWSPNGKQIVHQRYVDVDAPEIVVMDSTGQNVVRLTFDDHGDFHPKYSPDGTKIAFYSQPRIGPAAIWVMNSDGSDLRKVSPDYAWRFDWSPDGRKFVFLNWDFLTTRLANGELWIMNVDGTGLRPLTHFQDNTR